MAAAVSIPEGSARLRAQKLLLAASVPVGFVYRIYSAGDALAECDADGRPRLTILFTTSGKDPQPKTALQLEDGSVVTWDGWVSCLG